MRSATLERKRDWQKTESLGNRPYSKWLLERIEQIRLKGGKYFFCYGSDHLVLSLQRMA